MFKSQINLIGMAIVSVTATLFFAGSAQAAERSCSSSSVYINGSTDAGSTSKSFSHQLPDSYLKTGIGIIGAKRFDTPEKARKRACERANKYTVNYARAQHTLSDMARLMCATAKLKFSDEFPVSGNRVTLKSVTARSTRERKSHTHSLDNQVYSCDQFDVSSELRKASQFCGDYALTAIKMDRAIEQLGCAVEHHPEDGHRNYCSERSDNTVRNGIKHKRGVLNTCLDTLPLH